MPTDISNAVGTARQFTPQPDNIYQGRYQGIGVSNGAPSATNSVLSTAESLSRLTEALQGYAVSHEKYMDVTGHQQAEAMINGMTPADIQKLNTIDAAQLYGYADSTDNPYFKAYADKLRGGFLASKMKQEYDAQYEMYPARSLDEEQQRYSEFASKWKNDNLTGTNAPLNQYSFDMGYNESHLVNVAQLANQWVKKKNDNDVLVTMSQAQGDLGKILENSPQLLKTNGAMTAAVQTVFNNIRLMGLPANYREKLLQDFASEAIQSGHLDADRFEQMMNNVTVMSNLDGSTVNAASMLDMQTMRTAAADFNKQFMTQQKLDTINQYVKSKDLQGYLQKLTQMRQDDPDGAREFASLYAPISSGIATAQREEAARQKAQLKAQAKAAEQAQKQTDHLRRIQQSYEAYDRGEVAADSSNLSTLLSGCTLEEKQAVYNHNLQNIMNNKEMDDYQKITALNTLNTFPGFSSFTNDFKTVFEHSLDNIKDDGQGGATVNANVYRMYSLYQADSGTFASIFGSKCNAAMHALTNLQAANGNDLEAAIIDYKDFKQIPPDDLKEYQSRAEKTMRDSMYTIDNMSSLGGGSVGSAFVGEDGNEEIQKAIRDEASIYISKGMSAEDAVSKAAGSVRDGYYYYHGGLCPQGMTSNLQTNGDRYWLNKALDSYVYSFADSYCGDADQAENVSVHFSSRNKSIHLRLGDGLQDINMDEVRSRARQLYEDAVQNNHPDSRGDVDASIDTVNTTRTADMDFDTVNQERID